MLDTEFTEVEELGTDQLSKEELVDAVLVLRLVDYTEDVATKFGSGQRAQVELLVCDGPHAGTYLDRWTTFGLLARDLGRLPLGRTVAGKVTSGDSQYGTKWIGFQPRLDPKDLAVARKAVDRHLAAQDTEAVPF